MRVVLILLALIAAALVGVAIGVGLEIAPTALAPATGTAPATGRPIATPTATPSPTAAPSPRYQAFEDLAAGDCFFPIVDTDDEELLAGRLVPCDQPHPSEAFGIATHPAPAGAPFPGDEAMQDFADRECDRLFEAYVGISYDDSTLDATYYLPTTESWPVGDREILCTVEEAPPAVLTGSVKGSGR